jgi:hypothetical protein
MADDLTTVPRDTICEALGEICGGVSSFGDLDDWRSWFYYLLPRTHSVWFAPSVTGRLIELIVSALVPIQPDDLDSEIAEDLMATVGVAIMDERFWSSGRIVDQKILRTTPNWPSGRWFWETPSGHLSAELFFCVKYLRPDAVPGWIESVLRIEDIHWRGQMLAWMTGFLDVASRGLSQPAQFDRANPEMSWEGTWFLRGDYLGDRESSAHHPFFPNNRVTVVARQICAHMTSDRVAAWKESFRADSVMANDLDLVIKRFVSLRTAWEASGR